MAGSEIGVTATGVASIIGLAWFFFAPRKAEEAAVQGGVQEVKITVKGGYSPDIIRVREGVPLRLVFDRREASECSSRGAFLFTCQWGMYRGWLEVTPSQSGASTVATVSPGYRSGGEIMAKDPVCGMDVDKEIIDIGDVPYD